MRYFSHYMLYISSYNYYTTCIAMNMILISKKTTLFHSIFFCGKLFCLKGDYVSPMK